ncbi:carboxypeptidase-like regulatory domain-containing protein [Agromyces sp. LHK192]|uniref:carboxypeptidase-like regulatory domain-containing protein n=1 Tax=Agromyces sp. LHK192 TaxID=2498704 RepID=UPI000FD9E8F4|nr:carboxypeptidase-like regulatory domain-containing protein [Agromyces sp. LHK192]
MPPTRSARWISIVIAIASLLVLTAPVPSASASAPEQSVYGSTAVMDTAGTPLVDAYVLLDPVAGGGQVVAKTDTDGIATFTDAPQEPTEYRMRVNWTWIDQSGLWYRVADGFSADGGTPATVVISSSQGDHRLEARIPVRLGTGSVSGTVTAPDGNAVPGAHVEVRGRGSGFVTANSAGAFLVPHVPPGTFQVTASCTCEVTGAPFGALPSSPITVTLVEGEQLLGTDVQLRAKGRISGSLVRENAEGSRSPVVDPTRAVVVYREGFAPTKQFASYKVLSAPDGSWSQHLEPGRYQVVFGRYLTPLGAANKVFVPDQYYSVGQSASKATVVSVEAGIGATGIDAVYPDTEPLTVGPVHSSIVIADRDGRRVPGAVTVVTPVMSGESFRSASDQGGWSSFHAAPYLPTLAELRIEHRRETWVYTTSGFVPDTTGAVPLPIWIRAGGGEGITLRDRLPFRLGSGSIEGTVTAGWDQGKSVRATLTTPTGDVIAQTWTEGVDLAYTFRDIPDGDYRISFDHPSPDLDRAPFGLDVRWYRNSASLHGATPVTVAGGAAVELDHQTLAARGRISGAIRTAAPGGGSKPLTDRVIAVYPAHSSPTSSDAGYSTVDADGAWSIDLQPGAYRVAFGVGEGSSFVVEHYHGGGSSAEAVILEVRAAVEIPHIDRTYPIEPEPEPEPEPKEPVVRLAGPDRFATAAAISAAAFAPGVETAYIASGANFPDALAGAAAAGSSDSPVLLVPADGSLPDNVRTELTRLEPKQIIILGSPASIAATINDRLRSLTSGEVVRLAGPDRFATAAAISAAAFAPGVETAYIASGANFPDALAGAAAAGSSDSPVLLVPADGSLPDNVRTELTRLEPKQIIILGSPASIAATINDRLRSLTSGEVVRLAGPDRFATAAAISAAAFAPGVETAYIASGANFPDALAGAAAAGSSDSPVLLVPADGSLPDSVRTELTRLEPKQIIILGSPASIAATINDRLRSLTRPG